MRFEDTSSRCSYYSRVDNYNQLPTLNVQSNLIGKSLFCWNGVVARLPANIDRNKLQKSRAIVIERLLHKEVFSQEGLFFLLG